jgi:hypothetical protein
MASLMDFIMQQVSGRAPVTPTPERQQMFDVLSSYGATAPKAVQERQQMFDVLSSYGAGMPASMSSPIAAPVPRPPSTQLPMLVGQPMPTIPAPMPVAPMPTPRPAAPAAAPMPLPSAAPAPSVRAGFMQRLLGGPNYQSNNMPVVMSPQGPMASGGFLPQSVNWGDPESAADFFRADQAARQLGLLG